MRLSVRFLLLLFPVLAAVVFTFNSLMDSLDRGWALKDLYHRGQLVYHTIQDPIFDSVTAGRLSALHRIYARIENDPNLRGIMVCSFQGKVISKSRKFPRELNCDWSPKAGEESDLQAAIKASGMVTAEKQRFHQGLFLLMDENKKPKAYVVILHDPSFLYQRSEQSRRYTVYLFLALGFIISLITLLVLRWSVSRPVQQLSEVMKGVLTGDADKISRALEQTDFAGLVQDVDEILGDIRRSKANAPKGNSDQWSSERLGAEFQKLFGESKLLVVADQEPYIHERKGTSIQTRVPASGMVKAVEPIVKSASGVWVGHGVGSADRETADKKGLLLVPPEKPEYALKRVWLSREEEQGFFYGFSNEGLWPLCHQAHERPIFRHGDWQHYVEVNAKFASSLGEELKSTRPVILIQDYHFSLLPEMVRKMRPDGIIGLFWHIPWPAPEVIRICPWIKDILMGMLGADLIGFQSQYYCNAFLDAIDRFLEARVSREEFSVTFQGRKTFVKPFPVSVEVPVQNGLDVQELAKGRSKVMEDLGLPADSTLCLGIDRLDYTKGIIEKLYAVEKLLEKHKELQGKFVLLQVISPNRMHIKRYQDLSSEIQKVADTINWKFYTPTYQPIQLRLRHHSEAEIMELYRAANICFINSLHDGMNLVAKEFVATRGDGDAVLVLSSFAGASLELKDALIVNPYDAEQCAESLHKACTMLSEEKKGRMAKMRGGITKNNAFTWGYRYLRELNNSSENAIPEPDEKG